MKIAIFSDTHDNWVNTEKAIKYLNKHKIPLMIHCGDVCAPSTLAEMAKLYKSEIHLVKGNADNDIEEVKNQSQKHKNLKFYGHTGKLEIDNLKLVWAHEPSLAKKMAQSQKYDFIFYGHTHTPWQEKNGKTILINPGTLAGLFTKATFAIFDTQTKKARLIILEKI
ncbi:MAG: YfcE family phosphodiesterase [Candidatus Buchananbacteria bacterium]|nr:YfcE family phosphodiesterase [Candidatus Buchananbacteria bacterium]